MKRQLKRFLALTLTGVMLLSAVGCGSKEGDNKKIEKQAVKYGVWSTYNTTKVVQQITKNDTYKQLPAELSIEMMQDEYEGAQLIITSDKDTEYKLTAGELKNENGDVIPAENVEIYQQKYMTIKSNWNGEEEYSAGDSIPDMMLPMDKAVEYKENTIKKDNNQGVTVEVNSEGLKAGTYTGNFTLELGDKKHDIPVSVTVWDFAYEGRRTFQSSFLIYRSQLLAGEYDDSDKVMQAYVDTLLKNKANAYVITWEKSVEKFLEETKREFENKNCNSLIIPYDFHLDYTVYDGEILTEAAEDVIAYIKGLAKISTEEKPYIEYAYFYPSTYDEADAIAERVEPSERFLGKDGEYRKTLQEAVKQLKAEGWFAKQNSKFAKRVEEAILNIPAVFTNVSFKKEWVGNMDAVFCPYISLFEDASILNQYQEAADSDGNGKLWAYTCNFPQDPYPTFHLDDSTRDMRVCGWMEKAYNVTGYLYYEVNKYTKSPEQTEDNYVDVYSTPNRYEDANGDGFLLYPGKYYGSDTPFSSLRMASYRDSQDDYDMLCVYEKLLEDYAKKNNIKDFDFNDYVSDLYAQLFKGITPKSEYATLYEVRTELAKRILSLKNEGKITADPKEAKTVNLTNFAGGKKEITIKSESKDLKGAIGSKTKLYRPFYSVKVKDVDKATKLTFTYENTGKHPINMQIIAMTKDMEKITLGSSYCGVGKTRKVSINITDDMKIDMSKITEIRITLDNTLTDEEGKITLAPDKKLSLSDFIVTTE